MKISSMKIRKAKLADSIAISELYNGVELDDSVEYFRKVIDSYPAFVALDGGRIVGFAVCDKFAPDIIELVNIYVSQDYRNQKIGSKLLQRIESGSSKTEQYSEIIAVNSDLYKRPEVKLPATNFYLRAGYKLILETKDKKSICKELKKALVTY